MQKRNAYGGVCIVFKINYDIIFVVTKMDWGVKPMKYTLYSDAGEGIHGIGGLERFQETDHKVLKINQLFKK